jgi:hypothetical protein
MNRLLKTPECPLADARGSHVFTNHDREGVDMPGA